MTHDTVLILSDQHYSIRTTLSALFSTQCKNPLIRLKGTYYTNLFGSPLYSMQKSTDEVKGYLTHALISSPLFPSPLCQCLTAAKEQTTGLSMAALHQSALSIRGTAVPLAMFTTSDARQLSKNA